MRFDWQSTSQQCGAFAGPINRFSRRIATSDHVIHPKPLRASSVKYHRSRRASPPFPIPYTAVPLPARMFPDYTSSEDDGRMLMSSSLPNEERYFANKGSALARQGHRRSMSNQTISIREGQSNEIVLKSSMSDQDLILQNESFANRNGQFNQSMVISRCGQGRGPNIVVSNNRSENGVNSTQIETLNTDRKNTSMICVRNENFNSESGDGKSGRSDVFFRRSPLTLVSSPNCSAQYPRRAMMGQVPIMGNSASLDGFQYRTAPGHDGAIGRAQAKYVNGSLSSSFTTDVVNDLFRKPSSPFQQCEEGDQILTSSCEPIPTCGVGQSLVEYDSDTGWKRRSMPINMYSNVDFLEPISRKACNGPIIPTLREMNSGKDTDSRSLIGSVPAATSVVREVIPSSTVKDSSKLDETPKPGESMTVQSTLESHPIARKRSEPVKRRRKKSQSGHDVSEKGSTAGKDLHFGEYNGKDDKLNRMVAEAVQPKNATKTNVRDDHNSSDSIKNIIDEVRLELLAQPKKSSYLSDESQSPEPKGERNKEGDDSPTGPVDGDANDSESDDVFVSPFSRGRNASFSAKDKVPLHPKRRTSSLEDLVTFQKRLVEVNNSRMKWAEDGSSRKTSSSVSINETPQVHTYDDSGSCSSFKTLRGIARRPRTNSTSSLQNGLALLNTQPARGLLKSPAAHQPSTPKSPGKSDGKSKPSACKSPKKSPKRGTTKSANRSSDYDPRDRRRDGNGNERDMYRYRDKELSDREQKDSQNDSFNRSLSNTEGTPDDKIGKMQRTYL